MQNGNLRIMSYPLTVANPLSGELSRISVSGPNVSGLQSALVGRNVRIRSRLDMQQRARSRDLRTHGFQVRTHPGTYFLAATIASTA